MRRIPGTIDRDALNGSVMVFSLSDAKINIEKVLFARNGT